MTQGLPDIVHITLPDGGQGTVPKEDLAQAVAAGAHMQTDAEASPLGGLGGMALAALTGAGRAASLGASDLIASGAMGLLGGESARKDVLRTFSQAKEANPYSDMAGGFGGLVLGGVGALGGAAEAKAAGLVGEGLLGRAATMGARFGTEGGTLGAQQALSEDALGDHELNGQKIFASAAKDALLGAAGGAALGAGAHYFGKARGLLLDWARPAPKSALDEIAGLKGAGQGLREEARASEDLIDNLRKKGATSDQAVAANGAVNAAVDQGATYVDSAGVTRYAASDGVVLEPTAHAASGPLSGASDAVADAYKGVRRAVGGMDEGLEEVLDKGYADRATRLTEQERAINNSAAQMAESGTRMLRNLEDTVNEVQFTQKSGQFAKLVDATKADLQRDAVATLLQDTDRTLQFWEGTASKGGAEGSVKSLRKTWKDALDSMAKVENDATPAMSRDLYIKTDNLKRALDKTLQWGKESRFGLPEAVTHSEFGLEPLANKFRSALESQDIWGQAGAAQERWNGAFSELKARRDHFMDQLGVSIDQKSGIRIPEVDFAKARNMLGQLTGGETDAMLQPVKSTEAVIDGMRNRAAAIREFGDLTPQQAAKLEDGLKDLDHFEKTFAAARKESAIVNRMKQQQLEEQGHGVGGVLGLVSDVASRPLKTMERLAGIRRTAQAVESGIKKGVRWLLDAEDVAPTASKVPLRSKADVAKEIGDIRVLAGNPEALEARASAMVGDFSKDAPKTAAEVKATAKRAIYYLAREAPIAGLRLGLLGTYNSEPRFSDQQISDWETKRNAVLGTSDAKAPEIMLADMRRGKLNREAIKAAEFVSPKLFAMMQETVRDEMERMDQKGLLRAMPYQQKAAIASLLKIPADGTWTPDFIGMMQALKAPPPPPTQSASSPGQKSGRKADKPTAHMWSTESDTIEAGGSDR